MNNRLFWIDLETEGLDDWKDRVLEVGVIITDLQLEILEEKSWIVNPHREWTPESLRRKNVFVYEMHSKSGLLDEVVKFGKPMKDVDWNVHTWAMERGVGGDSKDPICGSSVGFDKGFMKYNLPQTLEGFSYRIIDVSSEKETVMRYQPEWYQEWQDLNEGKPKAHRALADIRNSIDEFKFYRTKRGDL